MKTTRILAIESSGPTLSTALLESSFPPGNGQEIPMIKGEIYYNLGFKHSEILKDCCDNLLKNCGIQKKDLTMIAVSQGPGSFTGLRVGISFARACAQALKRPLMGVSTFEVIAKGLSNRSIDSEYVALLIESIGQDVYWGLFKKGSVTPLVPYQVLPIKKVCELLEKKIGKSSLTFFGRGYDKHKKIIQDHLGKKLISLQGKIDCPKAGDLALIAFDRIKKSKLSQYSWKKVTPLYLRSSMAEERLKKA